MFVIQMNDNIFGGFQFKGMGRLFDGFICIIGKVQSQRAFHGAQKGFCAVSDAEPQNMFPVAVFLRINIVSAHALYGVSVNAHGAGPSAVRIIFTGAHTLPDGLLKPLIPPHFNAETGQEFRLQFSMLKLFGIQMHFQMAAGVNPVFVVACIAPGLVQAAKVFAYGDCYGSLFFFPGESGVLFTGFLDKIFVHPILFFIHIVVDGGPVYGKLRAFGQVIFSFGRY